MHRSCANDDGLGVFASTSQAEDSTNGGVVDGARISAVLLVDLVESC